MSRLLPKSTNALPPPRRTAEGIALLLVALVGPVSAGEGAPPADSICADSAACALGRREMERLSDGRSLVELAAGVDVGGRRFSYSDPASPNLPAYSVFGAPMASVELAMYPAAATGVPFLRDLGFRGHLERAFALDSATLAGTKLSTDWTRFGGDLHARIFIPAVARLRLGVAAGIDAGWFDLTPAGSIAAIVPGARVVALRLAADARYSLGFRLSLFAGGAYLHPLAATGVYERFRGPGTGGVDVGGGLAVTIGGGVEARLQARYVRYFSAFHPVPGDPNVAGGALDEQVQLGVRLVYAH